jgi:serine/threonine protein kinase
MTQAKIIFLNNEVKKIYDEANKKNKFSSIENELYCLNKFSMNGKNMYSPTVNNIDIKEKSYTMKKYSLSLGTKKEVIKSNIRRILFTITSMDLCQQLDDICKILTDQGINHRDINPGNLLFCESDKHLKVIDFYWAITSGIDTKTPDGGINPIYGTDDKKSIEKIKLEIMQIYKEMKNEIASLKKVIEEFGKIYYDGSASKKGNSYQMIDIPYFKDVKYQRDIDSEFKEISDLVNKNSRSAMDIGCAVGYNLFNLFRNFNLDYAIGYEADPVVFNFLYKVKNIFCLNNIEFINGISKQTIFKSVDVIVCMNVHMWLYKQFGDDVDLIMKNMLLNCNQMFFQTAGLESNGKFLVKKFTSKEIIKEYLEGLTSKKVFFIRSTKKHGGLRHLFKVE